MYNWQHNNWANFEFDATAIDLLCMDFAIELGETKGVLSSLSKELQEETMVQFMIFEAMKTSEIEGEYFSRSDVMSSIKKNLNIHTEVEKIRDKNAQGVAKLMVTVRNSFDKKLTEKIIKNWHQILMENSKKVHPGEYRFGTEPMQIVSGSFGKEKVHFEAPPSERVALEMQKFVFWYTSYETVPTDISAILIKTAITHLYFESIHPFEDGNGRIGRALAEKCISESLNRPVLMSLSSTIEKDKKKYYAELKKAQKTLKITPWIHYFSSVIFASQKEAKKIINATLHKTKFIERHKNILNERQKKAILKMFEHTKEHFEGGMTALKYVSINKTSRATATRDLQDLAEKKILIPNGEGRNRKYDLNLEESIN